MSPDCQSPCYLTPSNTRPGAIIKVTCENIDKKFATLTEKGCELFAQCALCHETAYKAKKMALHKAGGCGWREIALTSKRVDYKEGGEVGALVRPGDKDKFGSPTCVLEAELAVLVFSLLSFDSYKQYKMRPTTICFENRPFPKRVFYQIEGKTFDDDKVCHQFEALVNVLQTLVTRVTEWAEQDDVQCTDASFTQRRNAHASISLMMSAVLHFECGRAHSGGNQPSSKC